MEVDEYKIRDGLYYAKDHEWVKLEGNLARIGVTDYAQQTLHEVVFTELPEIGRKLSKGDTLGTLESVKAVAEVYTPLSGEIAEVNKSLTDAPELVNKSPYDKGWIAMIKPSNLNEELQTLLDASKYGDYIKQLSSQ
jgi:glycine cleavage system H protein